MPSSEIGRRQGRRRVEVGERGGRRRVGEVVGGDVDRLQRGDRVTTRRGDALLELTHLVGQGRLVAHGGRHAAEQRGDLGAGLGEAEDVVDEQQHVLLLHVAEVLRHRQRGQRDAKTRARRLVHLAEDQRGLLDDAGLGHLTEEVVALTGALADAGEHRHATEVLGDAVDHLLDEDGLADARTAEQADLAALDVGGEQVDDLDAGPEHLGLGLELVEARGLRVDPRRSVMSSVDSSTSSGLPRVFHTWPLVTSPTGTEIASPVSRTSAPRTRPSVGCIEMARTMLSPMCWATSRVSVRRGLALDRSSRRRAGRCRARASPRRGTPRRRPAR